MTYNILEYLTVSEWLMPNYFPITEFHAFSSDDIEIEKLYLHNKIEHGVLKWHLTVNRDRWIESTGITVTKV